MSFRPTDPSPPASSGAARLLGDGRTLVEQTATWLRERIDARLVRAGTRVPSIRALALERGISRFTVVEAYERLVANGYLESRRGSGFYVRERPGAGAKPPRASRRGASAPRTTDASRIDPQWLIRNMFRDLPAYRMPGSGLPPPGWMDTGLLAGAIRSIGRAMGGERGRTAGERAPGTSGRHGAAFVDYGSPQGYLPLREALQRKLAALDIEAQPAQFVTTSGATQAFDLVAREFVVPGDTVLVDDPAWFLMFGVFAAHGARVVGVPRLYDGPDLDALARLIVEHRPRFYVIASVLHNPTSTSLSPAKAFRVLQLAQEHDLMLVEDDVYADLQAAGRGTPAIRLASLDRLRRVIYVGSFSKTLAANLRVGFVACEAVLAERLADHKMLAALTTPELGERIACRILADGHYRKHADRLRARFDAVRDRALRGLERVGIDVDQAPAAGMFVWASAPGVDTTALAARLFDAGYLLAPGSLFSPTQAPSPKLRFNVATSSNPGMLDALARALQAPT